MADSSLLVGLVILATLVQLGATALFGEGTLDASHRTIFGRAALAGIGLLLSYGLLVGLLSVAYAAGSPIDVAVLAGTAGLGLLSYWGASQGQHLGETGKTRDSPADVFARTGGIIIVALSVAVFVL